MSKVSLFAALLLGSVLAVAVLGQGHLQRGEVTVLVVDENGDPVEGAHVSVRFNQPRSSDPWDGLEGKHVEGETDEHGQFTAAGRGVRKILMAARKPGYYAGQTAYEFEDQRGGEWLPRNPTVRLLLRPKVAPVAMYAKRLYDVELPVADEAVAYDLIAGDWVEPHGGGTKRDLVFDLTRQLRGRKDFDSRLVITAPGSGNGFAPVPAEAVIEDSEMKLPGRAPANGYVGSITMTYSSDPTAGYRRTISPEAAHFFLRVRSVVGTDGTVESALYGKLAGPVEYRVQESDTASLRCTYYVNPDGTRDVAFDTQRNLFERLPRQERVRQP